MLDKYSNGIDAVSYTLTNTATGFLCVHRALYISLHDSHTAAANGQLRQNGSQQGNKDVSNSGQVL